MNCTALWQCMQDVAMQTREGRVALIEGVQAQLKCKCYMLVLICAAEEASKADKVRHADCLQAASCAR